MINKLFIFLYMKIIFLILVTILVSCNGLIYGGDTGESYFDTYIRIVVNKFRKTMRNGNATLGIPVLDPFKLHQFGYKIQKQYLIEAQGYLQNLQVDKLSTYKIVKAEFSLIGIKINLHLIWDSIKLVTDYSLKGTLGNLLSIYGLGNIDLIVKGLDINVTTSLSMRDGNLCVRNFQLAIKLETFNIKVTGLFYDEQISNVISIILSDVIPQLIDDYQQELIEKLNNLATNINNDSQEDNILWELIFNS